MELERDAATEYKLTLENEKELRLEALRNEEDRKQQLFEMELEKKMALYDLELQTAEYKRDLAKLQLEKEEQKMS